MQAAVGLTLLGAAASAQSVWVNTSFVPNEVFKLSSHPAPFVHPRLLFSESDRADIAFRAATEFVVQRSLATINATLNRTLYDPSGKSAYAKAFADLSQGRPHSELASLNAAKQSRLLANDCSELTGTDCNLFSVLSAAAYIGWFYSNSTSVLGPLATAVAVAANQTFSWYNTTLQWTQGDLALAYDLTYNFMSEDQRNVTRAFIANLTATRRVFNQNPRAYIADQFHVSKGVFDAFPSTSSFVFFHCLM
jgi:hypothetical protein